MLSCANISIVAMNERRDMPMLQNLQHQFAYNHGRKRDGVRFLHCILRGM